MTIKKMIKISIVEDNPHFIIVDKPVGISIQDDIDQPGLISLLKLQTGFDALHPVHRLDKVTSGLLIVAKNSMINRELSKAFEQRQVEKYYLAISRSKSGSEIKKKRGKVVGDMRSARNGSWMLARSQKNPAYTQFFSESMGERYRLSIVKPKTGKTHQIRVALKSVSLPIVGDDRYGGEESDRAYLHSFQLSFECSGKPYSFRLFPKIGAFFNDKSFKEAFVRLTGEPYGTSTVGESNLVWHF